MSFDGHLYLRFRYGKHVAFLLVDPLTSQAAVSAQLLAVLRSRYPDGRLSTVEGLTMDITPAPGGKNAAKEKEDVDDPAGGERGEDVEFEFAILKTPTDHTQGWKPLGGSPEDPLVRQGSALKDGTSVAFRLKGGDNDDGWNVDFPGYLDEAGWDEGEEEGEEEDEDIKMEEDEDRKMEEDEDEGGDEAEEEQSKKRQKHEQATASTVAAA